MFITVGSKSYDMSNPEERRFVFSTILNPNSSYYDEKFYNWFTSMDWPIVQDFKAWQQAQNVISNGASSGDYTQVQGQLASLGYDMSADEEKFLDNSIAQQNAQTDRDFQTQMRDSSLLSTGNQLSQLGLSPSNVIQVGGASSGVTSNAAATNMHSIASLKQQYRINDYNQKMGLAKSIIGMAGSMASSGIYGSAIGAAKNAASKLATATAHSALQVMQRNPNGPKFSKDELKGFGFSV